MKLSEDFTPTDDFLPDGAFPLGGIVVVEYLNAEGETEHAIQELGTTSLTEMLGLLEAAKHILWETRGGEENE